VEHHFNNHEHCDDWFHEEGVRRKRRPEILPLQERQLAVQSSGWSNGTVCWYGKATRIPSCVQFPNESMNKLISRYVPKDRTSVPVVSGLLSCWGGAWVTRSTISACLLGWGGVTNTQQLCYVIWRRKTDRYQALPVPEKGKKHWNSPRWKRV
jgi:hypothetical protein